MFVLGAPVTSSYRSMSHLEQMEDLVREKVEEEKMTHAKLSAFLRDLYPGESGFSVRSLERFCSLKGLRG